MTPPLAMAEDARLVPTPQEKLLQVLEYSRLVLEVGPDSAPGACHALAEVLPAVVTELVAFRESQGRPCDLAMFASIWRFRTSEAERRAERLGLAGEERLAELANERGTREALDKLVAEQRERIAELEALVRKLAAHGTDPAAGAGEKAA